MKKGDKGLLSVLAAPRGSGAFDQAVAEGGKVRSPEVWLLSQLMRMVGNAPVHVELWDGKRYSFSPHPPVARVRIHDRDTLLRLAVNPDLYFGEAYAFGRIEVEGDLVEFLAAVYRSMAQGRTQGMLSRLLAACMQRPSSTSLSEARENIHAHYDIGNEFYRLWLDEEMVYTCAYFASATATLEEAQAGKMHHIARKLRLQPGETVVEAGGGWGSLALFLARHYGVKVRTYNISREQVRYARERARAEGLAERVEFIEDDYRNITGAYDAFVSVGMLEHVGQSYYHELGRVIDNTLKERGRGLIHSIGRVRPGPMNAWIERRIFPGACPPSIGEMAQIFEPQGLSVLDVENLRLHYVKTLEHWLARFDRAADRVVGMFDERFARAWRLYLAGSVAAFATGELQLYQVLFNRPENNDVPLTRAYMYQNHG